MLSFQHSHVYIRGQQGGEEEKTNSNSKGRMTQPKIKYSFGGEKREQIQNIYAVKMWHCRTREKICENDISYRRERENRPREGRMGKTK